VHLLYRRLELNGVMDTVNRRSIDQPDTSTREKAIMPGTISAKLTVFISRREKADEYDWARAIGGHTLPLGAFSNVVSRKSRLEKRENSPSMTLARVGVAVGNK
jgi:hypothetical protein